MFLWVCCYMIFFVILSFILERIDVKEGDRVTEHIISMQDYIGINAQETRFYEVE